MSFAYTAIGTAALGAFSAYEGAQGQKSAGQNAGNLQYWQALQNAEAEKAMYNQTRTDLAPWREAGAGAINQLSAGFRPGGQFVTPFKYDPLTDPSTQWRFQQGQNAINQSAAAQGGYFSGNLGKALADYGQNFASSEEQNAFNQEEQQKMDAYNMLAGLSGAGQGATTQTGQFGLNAVGNAGNYLTGGAQAVGQGMIGGAGAQAGFYQNLNNMLQGGAGMYLNYNNAQQMQNMFKQYLAQQNNSSYPTT